MTTATVDNQRNKAVLEELDLAEPVFYLPNDAFRVGADDLLYLEPGQSIYSESSDSTEASESGDYENLRGLPLLSSTGEAFLFRKMNYLKFLAEKTRLKMTKRRSKAALQELEDLLADADAVRNHIAECNLRLVISIARKFSASASDFDELMSEGNEILLKAIARFDYSRGFRFSTYAVHSIQRHYFRYLQRGKKRDEKEFKTDVGLLNELPEDEADELILRWVREEQKVTALIGRMAEFLDEREQHIVSRRFGLGDTEPQTLRSLAEEMQLSKERVRQLQISAIEKLSAAFDEFGPPEE